MKSLVLIACILLVAFGFIGLASVEQDLILSEKIIPLADVSIEEWLQDFQVATMLGILISLAASLLWFVIGQWILKFDYWKTANKGRAAWVICAVLSVIGWGLGYIFIRQAQEGLLWAYAFNLINTVANYYIATVLFSPSSVKYVPPGASSISFVRHLY